MLKSADLATEDTCATLLLPSCLFLVIVLKPFLSSPFSVMSNFCDREAEEDSLDESLSNKSDDEEEEEDRGEVMLRRKRPKGTTNTLSCPQSFPESILYCVEAYSAVLIKLSL